MTTRVHFRIDRSGDRKEVTALLLDGPAREGRVVCYSHIGQHSEATRAWVRRKTVRATHCQYASLLRELENIYTDVVTVPSLRGVFK